LSAKPSLLILLILVLGMFQSQCLALEWNRAVYWDEGYPNSWGQNATVKDELAQAGYAVLDADQLKTWMDDRITDKVYSVVVFDCVWPDTIIENVSQTCTLGRYLDAGGKIVWFGEIPLFSIGHADGSSTSLGSGGSVRVLGFPADGPRNSDNEVALTSDGITWGLTETWVSARATLAEEVDTVLATDRLGNATAWVKHYLPGDSFRGFVRFSDANRRPNVDDIIRLAEYAVVKATDPNPADGVSGIETLSLRWSPGADAVSHDVYLGTSPDLTEADLVAADITLSFCDVSFPGLDPGVTYYWRVDEVRSDQTLSTGNLWSFTTLPVRVWGPQPEDGLNSAVPGDTTLTWMAGKGGISYDVYFGENQADVSTRAQSTFQGNFIDTELQVGPLAKDKSCYWLVDQYDGSDNKVEGDLWSFTTIADIPIADPDLKGWWKLDEFGGQVAVDWSGHQRHGRLEGQTQWVNGYVNGAVSFEGGNAHINCGIVSGLKIPSAVTVALWMNANEGGMALGGGANQALVSHGGRLHDSGFTFWHNDADKQMYVELNSVDIEDDEDPVSVVAASVPMGQWHHVAFTLDGSTGDVIIYQDGVLKATGQFSDKLGNRTTSGRDLIIGDYSGLLTVPANFYGMIDDVRIYTRALSAEEVQAVVQVDPLLAWQPHPGRGVLIDSAQAFPMTWQKGAQASQHDVYLGSDRAAVAAADSSDPSGVYRGRFSVASYTPVDLDWGLDYFWRVDEIKNDGTVTQGIIWSFTLSDFLEVDNFESYTDNDAEGETIWQTWLDGWGVAENGSFSSYEFPPYAEQTIVHGGGQSMPLAYDNTGAATGSLVERTWTQPHDWTLGGVNTLTLWCRGQSSNSQAPLTISVNGIEVLRDTTVVRATQWTKLEADLSTVAGLNPAVVTKLGIGIPKQSAESGLIFIDDIRVETK